MTQSSFPDRPRRGPDGRWYIPGSSPEDVQASLDATLHERHREDLAAVLRTKAGLRVLYHIRRYCGTDSDLHPLAANFAGEQGARVQQAAIGMRHIGLWLTQQIRNVDPALLEQARLAYDDLAPDRHIEVPQG
jgi:hypothetical protein